MGNSKLERGMAQVAVEELRRAFPLNGGLWLAENEIVHPGQTTEVDASATAEVTVPHDADKRDRMSQLLDMSHEVHIPYLDSD